MPGLTLGLQKALVHRRLRTAHHHRRTQRLLHHRRHRHNHRRRHHASVIAVRRRSRGPSMTHASDSKHAPSEAQQHIPCPSKPRAVQLEQGKSIRRGGEKAGGLRPCLSSVANELLHTASTLVCGLLRVQCCPSARHLAEGWCTPNCSLQGVS